MDVAAAAMARTAAPPRTRPIRSLLGVPVVPLKAAPGVVACGVVAGSDAVASRGATAGSVSFDVIDLSCCGTRSWPECVDAVQVRARS
jgi:hypothetical protein